MAWSVAHRDHILFFSLFVDIDQVLMLKSIYLSLEQSVKVMHIELKIEAMKAKTPVCMETV